MANILIVEDDHHIARLITHHLDKMGHDLTHVTHGDEALSIFLSETFDLVILDLMLPGMDGLEICRQMRGRSGDRHIPVIMLTAKNEEVDKIVGLEMGADDYMTKPFSPRELTARVKAQLRGRKSDQIIDSSDPNSSEVLDRQEQSSNASYYAGPLQIFPDKYQVYTPKDELKLTPKEFELLKLLSSNPGQVFTRDRVLEKIWGYDYLGDTRTVDVHIRHLRQKIAEHGCDPDMIGTVRGVGYRFQGKEPLSQ